MTHLVVGLGEVGTPLRAMLKADGWDLKGVHTVMSHYDILHIAIPFGATFLDHVRDYQRRWTPDLTIIHSTVPIGTTSKFGDAVHSPVNGRHGRMLEDLTSIPKWFGGVRAGEASELWPSPFVYVYETPEQTEALKLICLMKYGAALAAAFLADDVAKQHGLDDEDLLNWDYTYNADVQPRHLKRPLLTRTTTTIGGHCVVPGAKHLAVTNPDPLLDAIRARG